MSNEKRVALLAGATGLVGRFLIQKLLASPAYDKVIAVTRRELEIEDAKLRQIVIPLDDMEDFLGEAGVKADDAFCALGTTIKRAGSQAAFRHVDFDYVVHFAEAAKTAGAKRFLLVSAVGASAKSPIFYSRVKGETEDAVSAIGFEATHIFRPSMLLGRRGESRPGESFAKALTPFVNPLLLGGASIYKGIEAETVAAAMVAAAATGMTGVHVHHFNEMAQLTRA